MTPYGCRFFECHLDLDPDDSFVVVDYSIHLGYEVVGTAEGGILRVEDRIKLHLKQGVEGDSTNLPNRAGPEDFGGVPKF
jgi:hypothetical protein